MERFEAWMYETLSNAKKQRSILLLTLLAFVASLMLFPTKLVLAKMLPGKSTNTFSIYVDLPSGSSTMQSRAVSACVVSLLQKEPSVKDIEVFNGMGSPMDYAGLVKGSGMKQGEHQSEIVVNLSDAHHRSERSFAMVHRLRPIIGAECEGMVENTSIKMTEQPAGPPTLSAVVVELYGKRETIAALSKEIKPLLQSTQGLVDVDILEDDTFTKYALHIDQEKARRSQLDVGAIHRLVYGGFEGMVVAYKNSVSSASQIPLFVVLDEKTRSLEGRGVEEIREKLALLKLKNAQGIMVPLSEVIRVEKAQASTSLLSKNLQPMVSLVAEADLVSQVYPLLEARSKIVRHFEGRFKVERTHLFDLRLTNTVTGESVDVVWDGEMKVTMDTFRDLGGAFIAALVLIFLLMVVYYRSFALSGIVLLGSFLSIIGVIWGHFVMDLFTKETFFLTATSLIGFISLMGISSRNALLLIDFSQAMMKEGMEKRRAIALASATRAKPIFLTAAAIILASTLLASDPIFGGLGVALIFGTMAAVVVSLIVVPILMDKTKSL